MVRIEEMKHKIVVNYSLSKMSQKQKVKFLRNLAGYREMKGKLYSHNGLLQEIKAKKLEGNVFIADFENLLKITQLFAEFNLKPEIIEVWTR